MHIPLLVMERLFKKYGAERISESAKLELLRVLEAEGLRVSKDALLFSQHAGRKTIKKEDIELAIDV